MMSNTKSCRLTKRDIESMEVPCHFYSATDELQDIMRKDCESLRLVFKPGRIRKILKKVGDHVMLLISLSERSFEFSCQVMEYNADEVTVQVCGTVEMRER